jgi:hypothetical protein
MPQDGHTEFAVALAYENVTAAPAFRHAST